MDVTVWNYGEDAFEASITVPLPAGVSYAAYSTKDEVHIYSL